MTGFGGAADGSTPLPSGVVTFVLTDVVGSTRLWERSPDSMAAALEDHEQIVATAVGANHGVVLKSRGEGDSTFSVFRLASDAASAAVAVQRGLAAAEWPPDCSIRVRISMHTGQAVERDGDYFGRAVNRAARVRAIAEAEQILVSRSAAELIVDHLPPGCRLIEGGHRRLKDLDRPESVYVLAYDERDGSAAPADRPGVPARLPLSLSFPARLTDALRQFVGRHDEQQVLHEALKRTDATARPEVVLIGGEPGIGKTSLAGQFGRAVHQDGIPVVYGRCYDDSAVPYGPWWQVLRAL